jgi:hypothetical protein
VSERAKERIEINVEQEDTIDAWWAEHSKSLRARIDEYKLWLSGELRHAHVQIVRLTEERDLAIKELVRTRRAIAQFRETLGERGL